MRHAFADGPDDSRDFVAIDSRIRCFGGIKRESLQNIAEVHSGCLDLDHDFPRPAFRKGKRHQSKRVENSPLHRFESQRYGRRELLLTLLQAANDSPHVAGFAAECDFALRVMSLQFRPQSGVVCFRRLRRQIDSTAGHIGILVRNDAHQSDGRRLPDRDIVAEADGLCSARHQIQPDFCGGPAVRESLREME